MFKFAKWSTVFWLIASACLVPTVSYGIEPDEEEIESVRAVRIALQEKYAQLPEVKLNAVTENVRFEIVDLKKSITEIQGSKYCAFRFKTGEKVSKLVWCFKVMPGLDSWYILPEKGRMAGFQFYERFYLSNDMENIGKKGEFFVVQNLTSRYFDPNSGYIMWFKIKGDEDAVFNLSLNMTPVPDDSRYSAVFPFIKL